MPDFDEQVISCFLKNQTKLFPEPVAENEAAAEEFLEECMAVVVTGLKEVWQYFEEQGVDIEGLKEEDILDASEVFEVGDGRYLIVEA